MSKKIAIIGAGPGGYVCAIRFAQLGAEVTLFEKARIEDESENNNLETAAHILRQKGYDSAIIKVWRGR